MATTGVQSFTESSRTVTGYPAATVSNERRQRQKEHEAAKRQAAAKAASRGELRRRIVIALAMGGVVVALLITINVLGSEDTTLPDRYLEARAQPTACGADAPPEATVERWESPADQSIDADSVITATIATSCGVMTVDLDPSGAPESVNAFVFLVRQGAYNGTVIDAVNPDLQVKGGDPEADGSGSHFMVGRRVSHRIPDEFPVEDMAMTKGVMGFSGDRSTRGTGLFVVAADDTPLSNSFNIIGEVTSGLETLDRIAEVPRKAPPGSSLRTAPIETIYIESITIEE